MQKPSPLLRTGASLLVVLFTAGFAGHAFAECEEAQESMAGKAVAQSTATRVAPAVAVTGKQMIDIAECNVGAGGLFVTFKYNFLAADGLYWLQGSAKVKGSEVSDFKVLSMSPNLSTATAAKGVKLASN